ncbi:MAG TPA: hypothetical protein HA370_05340 [Nanoarchaeota archaeon]|nr:hypothetical protein [Nanoarchaeota archaeon]
MGDVFEPVFVWKIAHWDTNYCLDKEKIDPLHPEWRDGGHHRAFAHYLARKPLLVVVSKKFSHVPLGLFSIREIKFDDNVENPFSSCFGIPCLDIEGKLRKDQRYRQ